MPTDPNYWDEFGRGPLLRHAHESDGVDPRVYGPGWSTFANQVEYAMKKRCGEFPEQFRKMMRKAIAEILAEILPELVKKELEVGLEPVREAYRQLLTDNRKTGSK